MSLLPSTLLNATSNEDQTLEIHSEILEPLSHSQTITRWEIPHKNILDSDSVMIWNVNCEGQAIHVSGVALSVRPLPMSGLYGTMLRARLFVNGKVISELNEVGKFLAMKYHFKPHEVKVERDDFFSYADNNIENIGGSMSFANGKVMRSPGDKSIGSVTPTVGNDYQVEVSLKLHQLFSVLKDAQLDTNNIEGKIMIECDWSPNNKGTSVVNNVQFLGTGQNVTTLHKEITINKPRLILDFLTYNAEVQAQIKNTIWGDGGGINMPYREIALVRKTFAQMPADTQQTVDYQIGMTGRAVQKIWVAKVMKLDLEDAPVGADGNKLNIQLQGQNMTLGENRSDLLNEQKWNVRVNDLMIYDRDVDNRAEEYNYLQQTGERQYTLPPSVYERRDVSIDTAKNANDEIWLDTYNAIYPNVTAVDKPTLTPARPHPAFVSAEDVKFMGEKSVTSVGGPLQVDNVRRQIEGRLNYLGVNLAKYKAGGDTPLNAMRIGSTPIVFTLGANSTGDATTTGNQKGGGTIYFWVEYLKMLNIKNGQVSVMDM
jgi:hypothetical protein